MGQFRMGGWPPGAGTAGVAPAATGERRRACPESVGAARSCGGVSPGTPRSRVLCLTRGGVREFRAPVGTARSGRPRAPGPADPGEASERRSSCGGGLQAVTQHRAVFFFQDIGPDLDEVVRSDPEEHLVEGRVMQLAEGEAVHHGRLTAGGGALPEPLESSLAGGPDEYRGPACGVRDPLCPRHRFFFSRSCIHRICSCLTCSATDAHRICRAVLCWSVSFGSNSASSYLRTRTTGLLIGTFHFRICR